MAQGLTVGEDPCPLEVNQSRFEKHGVPPSASWLPHPDLSRAFDPIIMVLAHFATAAVAFANATLGGSGLDGQYGCSPYYGSFVSKRDCLNAIDQLPWGAVERTYTVDKNPGLLSRHLPMARESGISSFPLR